MIRFSIDAFYFTYSQIQILLNNGNPIDIAPLTVFRRPMTGKTKPKRTGAKSLNSGGLLTNLSSPAITLIDRHR